CELAALLHDIADSKFHDGDETIGPRIAGEFLNSMDVDAHVVSHVKDIITNLSYKAGLGRIIFHSKALEIVQDADRLDAIGAIGIARALHYAGVKNRTLYDPRIKPNADQDKEAYKNSPAPTINQVSENLLLLKEKMNTEAAKRIAEERHLFMQQY